MNVGKSNYKPAPARRGMSLIEMAIVMGIVGAALGGIWVATSTVNEKNRVEDTKEGVELIVANLKNLPTTYLHTDDTFISNSTGQGVGIGMGLVPETFMSNGRAVNPWGDNLYIGYWAAAREFKIILQSKNLTSERCNQLVPYFAKTLKLRGGHSPGPGWWDQNSTAADFQWACTNVYGSGHTLEGGQTIYLYFNAGL